MALAIFPVLDGLSWNVIRRPKASTGVETPTSGRTTRVGYWANPMYEWELTYDLLRDYPWAPGINSEMRRMQGFFLAMQGRLTGFSYSDPDDNAVTGQFVALGDGTTILFDLVRTFGDLGYGAVVSEPIGQLDATAPFNVYLDGIQQASGSYGYVDTGPGTQQLGFISPPGLGVVITVDMSYLFYVHFKDDQLDFEKMFGADGAGSWMIKKIVLESLRPEPI